jgi:hypothetical protein
MAKKKNNIEDFLPKICRIKHEVIDKEIKEIKEEQKKVRESEQEIKLKLQSLKEDNKNLKDKIVLSEKRIGDKIDNLVTFDDGLKGNGKPGIWENIRTIKRTQYILIGFVVIMLGGRFFGISFDNVKDFFKPETKIAVVEKSIIEPIADPDDVSYILKNNDDNFYSYLEKKNIKEKMEKKNE